MAHVMIIDDDPLVSRYLEEHLAAEGHDAQSFALGEEGFQAALASTPDLILLDVMLPDATGFQMVNRFREHPQTREIPILMMSGTARHQNQKDIAKDMGANDYLVKPIDVSEMTAKIERLIRSRPKRVTVIPIEKFPSPVHEPISQNSEAIVEDPVIPEPVSPISEEPATVASETPPHADEQDFRLPEFGYADNSETPVAPEPEANSQPIPILMKSPTPMTWAIAAMTANILLASVQTQMAHAPVSIILRAAIGVFAGWMLLLGLLVGASALFRIGFRANEALGLLAWPAIPILARAVAAMAGFRLDTQWATPEIYWTRPLDIFEMTAVLILGISLRRKPGSSLAKAIAVSILIALGWCLTNRGYLQP